MAARPSSAKNSGAQDPALPQKKRARRRLVGAAAVCLAAAIVLPIVLDSEPRQIRGDVQVQIPSRDTPLSEPLPGPSRSGVIGVAPRADEAKGTADREAAQPRDDARADAAAAPPAAPSPPPGDAPSADAAAKDALAPRAAANDVPPKTAAAADAAAPDAVAAKDAAAKDAAAKDGAAKDAAAKEAETRDPAAKAAAKPGAKDPAKEAKAPAYLLQVGAFASEKGATEQLERVRKAGLKGYTERIRTPQGERIRVRVGPFPTRDAAEQARAKLRGLGIEPALIAP